MRARTSGVYRRASSIGQAGSDRFGFGFGLSGPGGGGGIVRPSRTSGSTCAARELLGSTSRRPAHAAITTAVFSILSFIVPSSLPIRSVAPASFFARPPEG